MTQDLNNLEIQILKVLDEHRGKDSAISRAALVDQVNLPLFPVSEREIRATMKHLITQHGCAIGSCHRGYYMAVTQQEIDEICKYYDSYGLSSLYVSSRLKRIGMRDHLGQLSMKFPSALNADATE